MRSYLMDWCHDQIDEDEIAVFDVEEALLYDLQYIAEHSYISFDWEDLREKLKPYKSNYVHLILN